MSSRRSSFTIIEILIAIVLVVIIIIAFLGSFISSFNYLRRSFELRTASLILQQEVSLVRGMSFSEIQALGGTFTSGEMASLHSAAGTILKSNYNGNSNIIKITFRLRWTSLSGENTSKTIVTLITDSGIDKK